MYRQSIVVLAIMLTIVSSVKALDIDTRFGVNERGNGTYQYLEMTQSINETLIDGWIGIEPSPDGTNTQLTIGLGRKIIDFGSMKALIFCYADRQENQEVSYSVLPAGVGIVDTKYIHLFLAPKVFLPFNKEAGSKLVINPAYLGFKWRNWMLGFSGTLINKELKRRGVFVRHGKNSFAEIRMLDLKDAGTEFLFRYVFSK